MTPLDITNYYVLTAYIDRGEYTKALSFINNHIKTTSDDRITLLHIFLLSELDYFEEAFNKIQFINNVSHIKLPKIYKNMNLLKELRRLVRNHREIYEVAILEGNMNVASKNARLMCDGKKHLFFVQFYKAIENKEVLVLDQKYLNEHCICAGVLCMGIERGVIDSSIKDYIDHVMGIDGDYLVLVKEMLCRDYLDIFTIKKILANMDVKYGDEKDIMHFFVNYLVKLIDDWKVYEFAIKNSIKMDVCKTVNYLHYLCVVEGKFVNFENLLLKLVEFNEIKEVLELAGEDFIPENEHYFLIHKYLKARNTIGIDDIKRAHHLFYSKKTLLTFKLLLALLLSTKEEKYLLLAFKIAREEQYNSIYYYRFIYLFIARFFCHTNEFHLAYSKFDVKNVIIPKMYGVWHRLYDAIKDRVISEANYTRNDELVTSPCEFYKHYNDKHKNFKLSTIKSINNSLIYFIENGLYHTAVELLELKIKLISDSFEIKECYNEFKDTLGDGCAYIFSDTLKCDDFDDFVMFNMHMNGTKKEFTKDIFINDVEDIKCTDFRGFISKLYEKYD